MRIHQPLQAEAVAHLLVCRGDEDQVARSPPALPRKRRECDRGRGNLPFHVERAPPPHLIVDEVAAERLALPFARVGQHDIGVRKQSERRAVATPSNTRDEVGSFRHTRVERALDARRLEVVTQQLGGERLVAWWIRRIEADQLLQEPSDLAHLRRPRMSR